MREYYVGATKGDTRSFRLWLKKAIVYSPSIALKKHCNKL